MLIAATSGNLVNLLAPDPATLVLSDIAVSLSRQPRWTGHGARSLSVAEHCVMVADLVYVETGDNRQALAGLLHDAAEAYTGDVATPIKSRLLVRTYDGETETFSEVEGKLLKAIMAKLGGAYPLPEKVTWADRELRDLEAVMNLPKSLHMEIVGERAWFRGTLPRWLEPAAAEREFLAAFERYGGVSCD